MTMPRIKQVDRIAEPGLRARTPRAFLFFSDDENASALPAAERLALLRAALRKARIATPPNRFDPRWSRTAGCRCGCSPGFVLRGLPPSNADIFIRIDRPRRK